MSSSTGFAVAAENSPVRDRGLAASAVAFALGLLVAGCSADVASPEAPPATPAPTATDTDAGGGEPDAAPAPQCGTPSTRSACGNDGAWVRGTVRFDAARFPKGSAPVLRVTLRHQFVLKKGEEAIGGRLHGWKNVPIKKPESGAVTFAIDMCAMGTAMWSEENDAFNLVLHIDEDGSNNLDEAQTNADVLRLAAPDKGELVKLVKVNVSCHAPPACVDVTLDCQDGTACTTIDPMKSCTKQGPGCKSDDSFCN